MQSEERVFFRSLKSSLRKKAICCEIYYDLRHNCIFVDWIGYNVVEDVKSGCRLALEAAKIYTKSHGCFKIVNDNRKIEGPFVGAVPWISLEWKPQMVAVGMRWDAVILSQTDYFSRESVSKIAEAKEQGMVTQLFNSEDAALAWLDSKHE